ECPRPGSAVFQRMASLPFHRMGISVSAAMPIPFGPRKLGQGDAGTDPTGKMKKLKVTTCSSVTWTIRMLACLDSLQGGFTGGQTIGAILWTPRPFFYSRARLTLTGAPE